MDSTKLCLLFYDDIIDWTMDNNVVNDTDLNAFYKSKTNTKINGPSFKIKKIPFQLTLYPQGYHSKSEGYVQLHFGLANEKVLIKRKIHHFVIYVELYCHETTYLYKRTYVLGHRCKGFY